MLLIMLLMLVLYCNVLKRTVILGCTATAAAIVLRALINEAIPAHALTVSAQYTTGYMADSSVMQLQL
jgi:hypothetical protein